MGAQILDELMEKIGGPKELAKGLAEHLKRAKKDPKRANSVYRLLMELIQSEDKATQHQNFVEQVAESQERGFVIEYVLRDRKLLETIIGMGRERGMLPGLPAPDVIEAEFERVS